VKCTLSSTALSPFHLQHGVCFSFDSLLVAKKQGCIRYWACLCTIDHCKRNSLHFARVFETLLCSSRSLSFRATTSAGACSGFDMAEIHDLAAHVLQMTAAAVAVATGEIVS
jgi:hypothetical protein